MDFQYWPMSYIFDAQVLSKDQRHVTYVWRLKPNLQPDVTYMLGLSCTKYALATSLPILLSVLFFVSRSIRMFVTNV